MILSNLLRIKLGSYTANFFSMCLMFSVTSFIQSRLIRGWASTPSKPSWRWHHVEVVLAIEFMFGHGGVTKFSRNGELPVFSGCRRFQNRTYWVREAWQWDTHAFPVSWKISSAWIKDPGGSHDAVFIWTRVSCVWCPPCLKFLNLGFRRSSQLSADRTTIPVVDRYPSFRMMTPKALRPRYWVNKSCVGIVWPNSHTW